MHTEAFMSKRLLLPALLLTSLAAAPGTHPASAPALRATGGAASAPATGPAASAPARVKADLSTPQATVVTFLTALQADDQETVKQAVSFADTKDPQTAEVFLNILLSTNQIQRAASERFGDGATAAFGDPKAALESRVAAVKKASPAISNDDAALTLPADEKTNQPGATIALKKTGGQWKIDATSLFGLEGLPPEDLGKRVALAKKLLEINKDIAGNIRSGKYTSATEARQDLWDRSFDAAKTLSPGVGTMPAEK
jgi:hypothetical protein